MKKASKIAIIIACVAMLVCVFTSTVSAANTYSDGRLYTPSLNVAMVGNYAYIDKTNNTTDIYGNNYKYASVINPPTDVLMPLSLFNGSSDNFILTNTINWSGLYNPNYNAGVHQAVTTTTFSPIRTTKEIYVRGLTVLNGWGNNNNVAIALNPSLITDEYFNVMGNNNTLFDGIRLISSSLESMSGTKATMTWSQYEQEEEGGRIKLVRRSITRDLTTLQSYDETINGRTKRVVLIPYFSKIDGTYDILAEQIYALDNSLNRKYYIQDLELTVEQNGVEQIELFATYDGRNELSQSIGSYLENVGNKLDFENISWTDWLADSVGSFMNFELVPGLSLSVIFLGVLGVLAIKAFLNAFAGG